MSIKFVNGLGKISRLLAGQSLIEILIAIGLASVLLPAILTGLVASREGKAQEGQRLEATALERETQEAVRSVAEQGWGLVSTNGVYHPTVNAGMWTLVSGADVINGYTRQLTISDVSRDSNFNVVSSGGTLDPSTKKVDVSVSWSTPRNSSVSSTIYLERYANNAAVTQTTQADFNLGSGNNTEVINNSGGEVALAQVPDSVPFGNKFIVTSTSSIGTMDSNQTGSAMKFTTQASKTVTAVRVYLDSEVGSSRVYEYGIQADSGGSPSGTFLGSGTLTANSSGWKTVAISPSVSLSAGTVYYLVVTPSQAPNHSRYVTVRQSAPQNLLYPYSNATDANSDTLFNPGANSPWTALGGQPIYELDFSDGSYEGNPYESSSPTAVYGTNMVGEKFTVSGSNKVTTAISFYVSKNSSTNPTDSLQVELRDSSNNVIESGIIASASQVSTSYAYQTYTFSAQRTLSAGSTYRIVLKSPSSNSANYYQVLRISTTNSANFNSITYDGTNSIYTSSSNSGSSWNDTNVNWDIGGYYFSIEGPLVYASSGDFTSGVLDAGQSSAFNNIDWTASVPAGTTFRMQVAVSSNGTGPFNFVGPDGTSSTYYTAGGAIPLSQVLGRYVEYKAFFTTSDGSVTPALYDVSINYSP